MAIQSGTHLGPYEITGAIDAGGMGEVYRARDSKLGRVVAIKVLPEASARDVERMARFQREARVLALSIIPTSLRSMDWKIPDICNVTVGSSPWRWESGNRFSISKLVERASFPPPFRRRVDAVSCSGFVLRRRLANR
jgi:serine/threonine protein kinase